LKLHLINPEKKGERIWNRALLAPLGLMCLAAYTPEEVETRIIDENLEKVDFVDRPDLVGITSMTATASRAYEIADAYRERDVKVVMGGIHASMLPEEAMQHADAVVVGEAETIWPKVLSDADAGRLEPLYRMQEHDDFSNPLHARNSVIDRKNYWMANNMQTARGCPHDCSFCSVTTFNGRHMRHRELDNVLAEIESMSKPRFMPKKMIPFVDDNIAANPKRAKELFKALIPLNINWGSQACISFGEDEELVDLAAESGCRMLFIGLETISSSSLEEAGKRQNKVEKYAESLRRLREHDIYVTGSFIFGFDADDDSIFQDTLDFAIENKIHLAQFSNLTPLPGTRLYDQMVAENRMEPGYWLNGAGDDQAVFQPKNFDPRELADKTRKVQRDFYSIRSIMKRFYFSRYAPHLLLYNLMYNRFGTDRSPVYRVTRPAQFTA
jgi:radical SAM superfamily enzyme YgiQ (UPF0313 family)